MPAVSARPSYPMGYYGQGNQFHLMPNPNWMSVREQMLQHQLLQERQQFEAWRASQAQPQPHPPLVLRGFQFKVEDDVEIISVRSAKIVMVSTPTSSLCGTPPGLSLPSRSSVPAGSEVCLGRKVVPSARMEALMRH